MAEKQDLYPDQDGPEPETPPAGADHDARTQAVRDLRETLLTILEDKEEATDPLPAKWRMGHLVQRGAGFDSNRPMRSGDLDGLL